MKQIEINGKTYRIKETFRAILDFEEKAGKAQVESLKDQILMFYFILKNANRKKTETSDKFTLGYEAFLDALDENMDLFASIAKAQDTSNEEEEVAEKK